MFRFPFIAGDGISISPAAAAHDVFSQIPLYNEGFNIQINELFGICVKVVMVRFYKGKWKATGKEFAANATQV